MIREIGITGGDDRKIGYYVGIIVSSAFAVTGHVPDHVQDSLFYLSQALTTLHWSCLSDCIGRKPIVLGGLVAISISNMSWGLSKKFWALVFRCVFATLCMLSLTFNVPIQSMYCRGVQRKLERHKELRG